MTRMGRDMGLVLLVSNKTALIALENGASHRQVAVKKATSECGVMRGWGEDGKGYQSFPLTSSSCGKSRQKGCIKIQDG